MKKIKILLADDHNIVRQSIMTLIDSCANMFVGAEADDGAKLVDKYFKYKPDVVLSDISMPRVNGLEAVKKIVARDPNAKIIFLTVHNSDEYIYRSVNAGASGLIGKDSLKGELITAVETVAAGGKYFLGKSEEEIELLLKSYKQKDISKAGDNIEQLTHREKQVLKELSNGLTSEEIADKLILGKRVVEVARSSIMAKLGIKSSHHLIRFAVEYYYKNKEL